MNKHLFFLLFLSLFACNSEDVEESLVDESAGMGLIINEFLASNENCCPDSSGDYDDWVELYNDSNEPIDIGGMYFTDNIDDNDPYQIPDSYSSVTTIQAKGYLLIWCDDDQEQGPLHVSNKLKKGGESIILLSEENKTIIDSYAFGEQTTDVSMGRDPTNVKEWVFFDNPTPGSMNN